MPSIAVWLILWHRLGLLLLRQQLLVVRSMLCASCPSIQRLQGKAACSIIPPVVPHGQGHTLLPMQLLHALMQLRRQEASQMVGNPLRPLHCHSQCVQLLLKLQQAQVGGLRW